MWHDSQTGSAISPLNHLSSLGNFSTELARVRCDANTTQIQSICVPAGLDGSVHEYALRRQAKIKIPLWAAKATGNGI